MHLRIIICFFETKHIFILYDTNGAFHARMEIV